MTLISLSPYKKPQSEVDAALRELPSKVVSAPRFPLRISAAAAEMIQASLKETAGEDGDFLRVGVKGGGCAGLQYTLSFCEDVDEGDLVTALTAGGEPVKVVTDGFSALYLKDTELDYKDSLQGAGFSFENPNARRTCGCGMSFST